MTTAEQVQAPLWQDRIVKDPQMEFAVEVQKLLGISLEGSVG